MIALVNYGLGNIQAFINIYRRLGIEVYAASTAAELRLASKIILPGVGSFDWAMERLNGSGLREALDDLVLGAGMDVLGVCVGMQMMAKRSEEGVLPGLAWVDAEVVKLGGGSSRQPCLPHMGWNDVVPVASDGLFRNMESPRFYFLHSYHVVPATSSLTAAVAEYGIEFAAALSAGNVFGTQFHPEKSHEWGIQLLRNFASLGP